ncbi:MAG: hypothetical protein EBR09_04395 [Proteobacteria bacterium]|nr:hypothetical protein [Pseudomonadota bacterium]
MNLSLREVVDAFERTSLDDRLHLIVNSTEELDVCIQFDRSDQIKCWTFYFREAREESAKQCSRNHFADVARAFRLDEAGLTKELAGHLLTQAAFADQFVREIQEILGEEAVRESIMRTQMFMDALKDAVSSALETKSQPPSASTASASPDGALQPPSGTNLKFRVIKGS